MLVLVDVYGAFHEREFRMLATTARRKPLSEYASHFVVLGVFRIVNDAVYARIRHFVAGFENVADCCHRLALALHVIADLVKQSAALEPPYRKAPRLLATGLMSTPEPISDKTGLNSDITRFRARANRVVAIRKHTDKRDGGRGR
jgi:hypothetical protein